MASSIELSPVSPSDAETITRHVEVPALLNGPLFRTMFPTFENFTSTEWEEMVLWHVDGLEEALENPKNELFLKACHNNGQDDDTQHRVPVGFCGWEIIDRTRQPAANSSNTDAEAFDQPKQNGNDSPVKTKITPPGQRRSLPDTLDCDGWIALSNNLRMERQHVLKDLTNVCRLTMMSVHPDFQKQGIGSLMMQRICEETDQCPGRSGYVLAAPEGVRLYLKFGFEIVGEVETPYGNITSMLRKPRL